MTKLLYIESEQYTQDSISRLYVMKNGGYADRTKIGIASVVDPDDRNDYRCFNNRIRALSQSGSDMSIVSFLVGDKSLITRLEREAKAIAASRWKSLDSITNQAGHGEWFITNPMSMSGLILELYDKEMLNRKSSLFVMDYPLLLIGDKPTW